jgi:hypothetical protein
MVRSSNTKNRVLCGRIIVTCFANDILSEKWSFQLNAESKLPLTYFKLDQCLVTHVLKCLVQPGLRVPWHILLPSCWLLIEVLSKLYSHLDDYIRTNNKRNQELEATVDPRALTIKIGVLALDPESLFKRISISFIIRSTRKVKWLSRHIKIEMISLWFKELNVTAVSTIYSQEVLWKDIHATHRYSLREEFIETIMKKYIQKFAETQAQIHIGDCTWN